MKSITRLLPLLFFSLPALAETQLPEPVVRLIAINPIWPGNGLCFQLQIKPQKNVSIAGKVEVASPLVLTDERGATLETKEVESVEKGEKIRPVDQIFELICYDMPECDWFRLGGVLRVTQGSDVRKGARHTCPTDKESSFTEGGVTFTVNGEEDRALVDQVWNERVWISRSHLKGTVCISCDASDACRIKSWELAGRKGMDLRFIHRATKRVDGRFIWFMSYDSVQREVQLRPHIFDTVQTVEVPVDCLVGINGQAKEVSPLPEGEATPGPNVRVGSFSWSDDDFPGMGGMVAGSTYALTIELVVDRNQGTETGQSIGVSAGDEIKVTDAKGRHIPCETRAVPMRDEIHLLFLDERPEGTWLKLEGAGLDGIYTLRGRR